MKHTMQYSVGGDIYDIPLDQDEAFRAKAGDRAEAANSYRVGNDTYTIPQSQDEAFKASVAKAGKEAVAVRSVLMDDGTRRDFTASEMSRFLRSPEYRESADYSAPEQKSVAWEGFKGALSGAAEGAYAGGKSAMSKVVAAPVELAAGATEAVGNALNLGGNAENAVGNWFRDSGRGVKAWLDENVKSKVEDDLGYEDWSTKMSDIAGDAAGMAVKFAPAAMAGGAPFMEAVFASDGLNAYARSYEQAKQNGANDIDANLAGAASGLISYYGGKLLMKGNAAISGIEGVLPKALAGIGYDAAVMGAQTAGEKGVQNVIEGKPITEGMGGAFAEGAETGALFRIFNEGSHVRDTVRETKQMRDMRRENLLTAAESTNGGAFLDSLNVGGDKMDEAVRVRRGGGDISRSMGKALDLPDNMSREERNEVVDSIIRARDAQAERVRTKMDDVQAQALADAVGGVIDINTPDFEKVWVAATKKIKDAAELDDPSRRAEIVADAVKEVFGEEAEGNDGVKREAVFSRKTIEAQYRKQKHERDVAAMERDAQEQREGMERAAIDEKIDAKVAEQKAQKEEFDAEVKAKAEEEYGERMAAYEEARAKRAAEMKKTGKATTELPEKPDYDAILAEQKAKMDAADADAAKAAHDERESDLAQAFADWKEESVKAQKRGKKSPEAPAEVEDVRAKAESDSVIQRLNAEWQKAKTPAERNAIKAQLMDRLKEMGIGAKEKAAASDWRTAKVDEVDADGNALSDHDKMVLRQSKMLKFIDENQATITSREAYEKAVKAFDEIEAAQPFDRMSNGESGNTDVRRVANVLATSKFATREETARFKKYYDAEQPRVEQNAQNGGVESYLSSKKPFEAARIKKTLTRKVFYGPKIGTVTEEELVNRFVKGGNELSAICVRSGNKNTIAYTLGGETISKTAADYAKFIGANVNENGIARANEELVIREVQAKSESGSRPNYSGSDESIEKRIGEISKPQFKYRKDLAEELRVISGIKEARIARNDWGIAEKQAAQKSSKTPVAEPAPKAGQAPAPTAKKSAEAAKPVADIKTMLDSAEKHANEFLAQMTKKQGARAKKSLDATVSAGGKNMTMKFFLEQAKADGLKLSVDFVEKDGKPSAVSGVRMKDGSLVKMNNTQLAYALNHLRIEKNAAEIEGVKSRIDARLKELQKAAVAKEDKENGISVTPREFGNYDVQIVKDKVIHEFKIRKDKKTGEYSIVDSNGDVVSTVGKHDAFESKEEIVGYLKDQAMSFVDGDYDLVEEHARRIAEKKTKAYSEEIGKMKHLSESDKRAFEKLSREYEEAFSALRTEKLREEDFEGETKEDLSDHGIEEGSDAHKVASRFIDARDALERFHEQAVKYSKLKRGKDGRPIWSKAEADRIESLRSDPAVRKWVEDGKRGEVVDGKVSPRNVVDYLRDQVDKAVTATKRLFSDAKVEVKDREYNPLIDEAEGATTFKAADGRVVGTFDPATKRVTLYRGADAKTVYHELIGHGVEDWAARNNKPLHDKLIELAKTAPKELADAIRERYPDADEATLAKEIIANIAEGKGLEHIKLKEAPKAWYAKAYVAVRDAIVGFMEKIGLRDIDLSKIDEMSPNEAMDHLMKEIAKGKTLGKIGAADADGKVGRIEKWADTFWKRHASLEKIDKDAAYEKQIQPGKEAAFQNLVYNKRVGEMKKMIADGDIAIESVDEYMKATAALERNRADREAHVQRLLKEGMSKRMAEEKTDILINKLNNGTSGMSDAVAEATIKHYEGSAKFAEIKKVADFLWKMQDEGMMERVRAGLISQKEYDGLKAKEPHHVPFRSAVDETTGEWVNDWARGMDAPEFMHHEGRFSESGSPSAWMFQEFSNAFMRGIENDTRLVLAKAVEANPALGKIVESPTVKEYRGKGSDGDPNVVTYKTLVDVMEPVMEPATYKAKDGTIKVRKNADGTDMMRRKVGADGKVVMQPTGEKESVTRHIYLNGERGAMAASSYTNAGMSKVNKVAARAMRMWAATATELSPTFALRNFSADNLGFAKMTLLERGAKEGSRFLKDYTKNHKAVAREVWDFVRNGNVDENSTLGQYMKSGAMIGGFQREGYTDIRDAFSAKAIAKEFAAGRNRGSVISRYTLGLVKAINGYSELANRVADFKTRLEWGEDMNTVVKQSREDFVDFNQKGNLTPITNTLWMFSNSTIGATMRQLQSINKAWRTPQGRRALLGLAAYGVAEAVIEHFWNAQQDAENEKKGNATGKDVTEHTRKVSLYFRNGGNVFRLPVHEDPIMRLIYAANATTRLALGDMDGKTFAKELGGDIVGDISAYFGMGTKELAAGVNTWLPSTLQPFVQHLENKDYAGRPIYRPKFNEALPDSQNGRKSTSEVYKWFAKTLNAATGGNEGRAGAVDIAPETAKLVTESVVKNMGKDLANAADTGWRILTGDFKGVDSRRVPVVRDLVRKTEGNDNRYFDAKRRFDADKEELKKRDAVRAWGEGERRAYYDAHPWLRTNGRNNTAVERLMNGHTPEGGAHQFGINELRRMENGEMRVKTSKGYKWRPHEWTDEQVEKFKAKRLEKQALVLKLMGED